MAERIIPTMGRNNCGGRCRILVHENDGKIISIKGDPAYPAQPHAVQHGAVFFL